MKNCEIMDILNLLKSHNESNGYNEEFINNLKIDSETSYYIVSATGYKKAYYTLYLFSAPIAQMNIKKQQYNETVRDYLRVPVFNPFIYKGNLANDDKRAIQKALVKCGKRPIVFYQEDKLNEIKRIYNENIFWFGKYAGEFITDVFKKDRQYCFWIYNSLVADAEVKTLSKRNNILFEKIKVLRDAWFEAKAEQNKINKPSEYREAGKIKNIKMKVISIKKGDDYFKANLIDNYGYYYFMYPKIDLEVNDEVVIISARVQPKCEFSGIKYNYLNYVKLEKIIQI